MSESTSTLAFTSMPLPARKVLSREGTSKYDLSKLEPGSEMCIVEVGVVVPKRAVSRVTSAVTAFRKRPGNENAAFAVRTFQNADGQDCVGVWRLVDKALAADEAAA